MEYKQFNDEWRVGHTEISEVFELNQALVRNHIEKEKRTYEEAGELIITYADRHNKKIIFLNHLQAQLLLSYFTSKYDLKMEVLKEMALQFSKPPSHKCQSCVFAARIREAMEDLEEDGTMIDPEYDGSPTLTTAGEGQMVIRMDKEKDQKEVSIYSPLYTAELDGKKLPLPMMDELHGISPKMWDTTELIDLRSGKKIIAVEKTEEENLPYELRHILKQVDRA